VFFKNHEKEKTAAEISVYGLDDPPEGLLILANQPSIQHPKRSGKKMAEAETMDQAVKAMVEREGK
jgi:hypothetical protein